MGRTLERRTAEGLWFDPDQRRDLIIMIDLLEHALRIAVRDLEETGTCDLEGAEQADRALKQHCAGARNASSPQPESGIQAVHASPVLAVLLNTGEEAGGHVLRISKALAGAH